MTEIENTVSTEDHTEVYSAVVVENKESENEVEILLILVNSVLEAVIDNSMFFKLLELRSEYKCVSE